MLRINNKIKVYKRFRWHGKCYFGAAHGICGVLQTLIAFPERELKKAGLSVSSLQTLNIEMIRRNQYHERE